MPKLKSILMEFDGGTPIRISPNDLTISDEDGAPRDENLYADLMNVVQQDLGLRWRMTIEIYQKA